MAHAETLYQAAIANGWTPAQVKNATRSQVAKACNVDLETVDPPTFLAWNIKRRVAARLEADADSAQSERRRKQVLAKVRELTQETGATAEFVKDGDTAEGPCIAIRRKS